MKENEEELLAKKELLDAANSASDVLFCSSFDGRCYLSFIHTSQKYKIEINIAPIKE